MNTGTRFSSWHLMLEKLKLMISDNTCNRDIGSFMLIPDNIEFAWHKLPSLFSKSMGLILWGIVEEPTSPAFGIWKKNFGRCCKLIWKIKNQYHQFVSLQYKFNTPKLWCQPFSLPAWSSLMIYRTTCLYQNQSTHCWTGWIDWRALICSHEAQSVKGIKLHQNQQHWWLWSP